MKSIPELLELEVCEKMELAIMHSGPQTIIGKQAKTKFRTGTGTQLLFKREHDDGPRDLIIAGSSELEKFLEKDFLLQNNFGFEEISSAEERSQDNQGENQNRDRSRLSKISNFPERAQISVYLFAFFF